MNPGFKVFNPAIASGVGRGNVASGTPTLISFSTEPGDYGDILSFQIVTTGDLAGDLTVEYSNYSDEDFAKGLEEWDTVTLDPAPPAISGATKFGIPLPAHWGRYRLKFVVTSGTGTIAAVLNQTRRK